MKKIFLVILMVMFISGVAFASQGSVDKVFDNEVIAKSGVVTSRAFRVNSSDTFGAWLKQTATVTGSPSLGIELEQSYSGATNTWATSTTLIMDDWTNSDVASVTTISPTPMKWMRFKATENGVTGTTLNMYLFSQG